VQQYKLVDYIKKKISPEARLGGVSPEIGKIGTFLADRDYYDYIKKIEWDKENYLITVYYSYTISNYEGDMNKELDEKLLRYWSLPLGELDKYAKIEDYDLDIHQWELVNPHEEEFVMRHCVPLKEFGGYRIYKVIKDVGKDRDIDSLPIKKDSDPDEDNLPRNRLQKRDRADLPSAKGGSTPPRRRRRSSSPPPSPRPKRPRSHPRTSPASFR